MNRTRHLLLVLSFGLLAGCSAPHDNPLDPDSDRYRPQLQPADLVGRVRSVHISRNFPSTDTYSLLAELTGSDAVLLDSATVRYTDRPAVTLARTSTSVWATTFSASYFGTAGLGTALGMPFLFESLDLEGVRRETGPVYLFRVIEGVPRIAEPDSQDIVGAFPELTWEEFDAGFSPFYYRPSVVVLMTDGFQLTVWTSDLLPSTTGRIQVPDSLPEGQYYWTLTVVDTFENTSRSKEGTFVVAAAGGNIAPAPRIQQRDENLR